MANIQHKDIPDSQLHEPKGVASAPGDTLYVADGNGSGRWRKLPVAGLQGLTGSEGAGLPIVSDGNGGFKTGSSSSLVMLSQNASSGKAIVGTGGDYVYRSNFNIDSTGNFFVPVLSGLYQIELSTEDYSWVYEGRSVGVTVNGTSQIINPSTMYPRYVMFVNLTPASRISMVMREGIYNDTGPRKPVRAHLYIRLVQ